MIRSADPNFTLVLIDGVKVNDPNNSRGGLFDLSTLSPDNVERIEIATGPLSSMYGSDALDGVIHIIIWDGKGEAPAVSAEASGGRFNFIACHSMPVRIWAAGIIPGQVPTRISANLSRGVHIQVRR